MLDCFDELNDNEKRPDMTMENDVLENKRRRQNPICPRSQYSMSMIQMHAEDSRRENVREGRDSRKNQERPPRRGNEEGSFMRFEAHGRNPGYNTSIRIRAIAQALR